jgi:hypothetical protein
MPPSKSAMLELAGASAGTRSDARAAVRSPNDIDENSNDAAGSGAIAHATMMKIAARVMAPVIGTTPARLRQLAEPVAASSSSTDGA